MSDRLETLIYSEPAEESTREPLETSLFLTQPGEFLVEQFAAFLRADPAWSTLFGDSIDSYDRMDYSIRQLPAMRCYIDRSRKNHETWYEEGEIKIDIIWPPAIRRTELQRFPATIAGAMVQQLRRPTFFVNICDKVPGLNELGKSVNKDLSLGFQWSDGIIPLTQLTANFRINLAEWDEYMEADGRELDSPFIRSIEDLKELRITIDALADDGSVQVQPEGVTITGLDTIPE